MNLHQILHSTWTLLHRHYLDDSEGHSYGATGDWQLHHDNVPANTSRLIQFFSKTSNHSGVPAPLQPRFGALWLLAFPKTKIIFERKQISDCRWDLRKYDGAADGGCVRSQGACFEVDWGIIALYTMFLVSCIFFTKCLYFSITWLDSFWTDLIYVSTKQQSDYNLHAQQADSPLPGIASLSDLSAPVLCSHAAFPLETKLSPESQFGWL